MGSRVDWDYWRQKYVTGDMLLKDLAEGHNAPAFKTLRNKSSEEDWPGQRRRFQDMKRTQALLVPDVQQTVETAKKIIDSAEMLTQHNQIAKALLSKGIEGIKTLDPSKMRPVDIAHFLKLGIDVQRLTEGLATQRQQIDFSTMSDAELEKLAKGES